MSEEEEEEVKFVRGSSSNASAVLRKTLKSVSREERDGVKETEVLDEALRRTLLDVRKRPVVFKFEALVVKFMRSKKNEIKFPPLKSFHRMLLHHIADRFQMDHAVLGDRQRNDQRGVVLRKNARTEMPSKLLVNFDLDSSKSMPKNVSIVKKVKKREKKVKIGENTKESNVGDLKTHEERQKSYEEARARIFGSGGEEESSSDDEAGFQSRVNAPRAPAVMYSAGPDMMGLNGFGFGRGRGRGSTTGFGRGRGRYYPQPLATQFGGLTLQQQQQQLYYQRGHLVTQPQSQWAAYQEQQKQQHGVTQPRSQWAAYQEQQKQQRARHVDKKKKESIPTTIATSTTHASVTTMNTTTGGVITKQEKKFDKADFPPLST